MAEIRYGDAGRETVMQVGETFTIGRLGTNTLMLDNDAVSREHARIDRRGTTCTVSDLDSRNGTFVDRGDRVWKVEGTLTLQSGDVIIVGDARITFLAEDAPPQDDGGATIVGRVIPAPRRDD